MSLAQVKSFFGKVSQDPALQGKLRALQLESKRAWLAAIVELGSETGHSFTAAEFETAVAELQAEPRELGSCEELDQVTGGVLTWTGKDFWFYEK